MTEHKCTAIKASTSFGEPVSASTYLIARQAPWDPGAAIWHFFDMPNLRGQVVALPPSIAYCPWCGEQLPQEWKAST